MPGDQGPRGFAGEPGKQGLPGLLVILLIDSIHYLILFHQVKVCKLNLMNHFIFIKFRDRQDKKETEETQEQISCMEKLVTKVCEDQKVMTE